MTVALLSEPWCRTCRVQHSEVVAVLSLLSVAGRCCLLCGEQVRMDNPAGRSQGASASWNGSAGIQHVRFWVASLVYWESDVNDYKAHPIFPPEAQKSLRLSVSLPK